MKKSLILAGLLSLVSAVPADAGMVVMSDAYGMSRSATSDPMNPYRYSGGGFSANPGLTASSILRTNNVSESLVKFDLAAARTILDGPNPIASISISGNISGMQPPGPGPSNVGFFSFFASSTLVSEPSDFDAAMIGFGSAKATAISVPFTIELTGPILDYFRSATSFGVWFRVGGQANTAFASDLRLTVATATPEPASLLAMGMGMMIVIVVGMTRKNAKRAA